MIWGWATTKEGWSKLRSAYFEPLNFPTLLPNSSVRGYWSVGSYRARVGLIDTWDLPLVEKMIKERWFCLIPPANLITNNGVDSHASHTKKQEFPIGYSRQKLTETYELDLLNMAKIANRYDTFLNKSIYKIRFKHFFSPIKLWLMRRNFNENLQSSLAYRIQTNELPKD
jgi:hypothetical protein